MNNERRKQLERAGSLIDEARGIIEDCAGGEREYFDNMPESIQGSEKGQRAETIADALDEALEHAEQAMSSIDEATNE